MVLLGEVRYVEGRGVGGRDLSDTVNCVRAGPWYLGKFECVVGVHFL